MKIWSDGIMRKFLAVIGLVVLTSACAGLPGSAPTNFYVIKPAAGLVPEAAAKDLPEGISVGVGPIQIPGYADRAQIITFDAGSRVTVADFDHWAAPLGDTIKRISSANVAALLGEENVFPYPADFRPDQRSLQIALEIVDIGQLEDGRAWVNARWHVKRLYDNQVAMRGSGSYEETTTAGDYDSYAEGLSVIFGRLAKDLVASLDKVQFDAPTN
ncbi:MAG: PqiC family protein [Sneathiella sp.]